MPPLDDAPFFFAATQTQLFEFTTQAGQRRLGKENTRPELSSGISALLYDVPFDFVDTTQGTEVAVGLHHCVFSLLVF